MRLKKKKARIMKSLPVTNRESRIHEINHNSDRQWYLYVKINKWIQTI